ncbi:SDR family NAD(P)-dependent oxidoreductase [Nocardioides luti]|uniref:SDR family NAD(P)-dependent oxidoreductase n=1 Tax=Nocardioides luti TaxID=2761101 RepID=UPI001C894352
MVIAGGSSGIGYSSAERFIKAGVRRIALLSKDPGRGADARNRLLALPTASVGDMQVHHVPFDATDTSSVEDAVGEAHQLLGGLDAMVNSISSPYTPELLFKTSLHDIPAILAAQAIPPMLLSRAALPYLTEGGGGSIVNVASDAAKAATPGETVLGAAMAAITMFTRTLAAEGKRNGIRANILTPSLIAGTPTTDRAMSGGFSKKLFEKAAPLANLGVASADDQGALVVFLCGPGAARLTGQAISVNGGISLM